jgi:hypothetical protein
VPSLAAVSSADGLDAHQLLSLLLLGAALAGVLPGADFEHAVGVVRRGHDLFQPPTEGLVICRLRREVQRHHGGGLLGQEADEAPANPAGVIGLDEADELLAVVHEVREVRGRVDDAKDAWANAHDHQALVGTEGLDNAGAVGGQLLAIPIAVGSEGGQREVVLVLVAGGEVVHELEGGAVAVGGAIGLVTPRTPEAGEHLVGADLGQELGVREQLDGGGRGGAGGLAEEGSKTH